MEWLNQIAQDQSRATGNPDWETKMKQMVKDTQERAMNRKLTAATKGIYRPLNTIQIPTHDWFLSPQQNELYKYEHGNFKAYPADASLSTFYTHHTLKVLPPDSVLVEVELNKTNDRYRIKSVLPKPKHTWQDITTPSEMETTLLAQNKRHLQQTVIKGGTSDCKAMTAFREEMGLGSAGNALLQGPYQIEYEVGAAITTWMNAVKQTEEEQSFPPVIGSLSTTKFQGMFRKKHEATSSNPCGMNYSIWKAMAKSNHLSSFLSILSLPFIYGFDNTRWMNMIDVMPDKKTGVHQIHMLRIIGLVCTEYNTALSYFIGHRGQQNFENTSPLDKQHGSRQRRQAIDTAMLKLLTMETARHGRRTIAMTQYHEKNCFDRIFQQNSNIFARKAGISHNLLKAQSLVKDNMKRKVKTGLGITEGTHHQRAGKPTLEGKIQGTADTPLLYSMLSSVAIKAHKSFTPGLSLESPTMKQAIKHHNVVYVNAADGHVSVDATSQDPTFETVTQMHISAQGWNDVNNLTGGSLAYHKTKW